MPRRVRQEICRRLSPLPRIVRIELNQQQCRRPSRSFQTRKYRDSSWSCILSSVIRLFQNCILRLTTFTLLRWYFDVCGQEVSTQQTPWLFCSERERAVDPLGMVHSTHPRRNDQATHALRRLAPSFWYSIMKQWVGRQFFDQLKLQKVKPADIGRRHGSSTRACLILFIRLQGAKHGGAE